MGAGFSDYLCKELGWELFCKKKVTTKNNNRKSPVRFHGFTATTNKIRNSIRNLHNAHPFL